MIVSIELYLHMINVKKNPLASRLYHDYPVYRGVT